MTQKPDVITVHGTIIHDTGQSFYFNDGHRLHHLQHGVEATLFRKKPGEVGGYIRIEREMAKSKGIRTDAS